MGELSSGHVMNVTSLADPRPRTTPSAGSSRQTPCTLLSNLKQGCLAVGHAIMPSGYAVSMIQREIDSNSQNQSLAVGHESLCY